MTKIGKHYSLITGDQVQYVIDNAIKGDHKPFNDFLKKTYTSLYPKLLVLIKSQEEVKEVFMIAMQKFWECFVIDKQPLPNNSIVYIYVICKNNWLLRKKNLQKRVTYNDQIYYNKEQDYDESSEMIYKDHETDIDDYLLKHKSFTLALEALPSKCKELIEANLDPEIRLKSLQQKLNFLNYQSLVQAKYNCKKKLIKNAYEIFDKLKKNSIVNQ